MRSSLPLSRVCIRPATAKTTNLRPPSSSFPFYPFFTSKLIPQRVKKQNLSRTARRLKRVCHTPQCYGIMQRLSAFLCPATGRPPEPITTHTAVYKSLLTFLLAASSQCGLERYQVANKGDIWRHPRVQGHVLLRGSRRSFRHPFFLPSPPLKIGEP